MTKLDQAARTLIIHCMVQRLTVKESLDYLRKHDIDISKAWFLEQKRRIKESRFSRMREIADTGFIDYHLDAIDTMEWAKKEMIANYDNEQDPYKRVEILTQIINMLPYFAEYISESKKVMELKAIAESSSSKEEIKTTVPS
jgi:hypothetical protein